MTDDQPRRWYDMVRAAAGDAAVIRIFGDIGESWWYDSVSASNFAKELDALGDISTLEIRLNSPGGDMFDGVAIYNTLRTHSARKTIYVDGLAASAASVIAMAADELVMGTGTQFMIHNAVSIMIGDAEEFRKQADVLESFNLSMASIYADRAGGTVADWSAAMAEETWYGAQEAVAAGLADRVTTRDGASEGDDAAVAATLRGSRFAAKYRYKGRAHAPAPKTPSRAAGNATEGGSVQITDEDFAALRTKLGLGDDAEIGDVIDALDSGDDSGEAEEEAAPAAEKVAAKLPDGVLAVDRATWDQVQADARLGREAREAQVKAQRIAKVDAAIAAGKILPVRRDHWIAQMDADEDGVTATLNSLTALFGTTELGHDDGSVIDDSTLEGVRGTTAYQNWKVVG